jgi:hypothetical protein
MDLPLQGGVDQDETLWMGAAYPGSLASFEPQQTDRANKFNPRLVVVHWSTATDNATLTLSGQVSEIMHASCQWAESNAAPGLSQHAASGVLINDAANLLTSESTANVDGVDATTQFSVGDFVLNAEGAIVGTLTALDATSITLSANATVQMNDDAALHKRTPLVLTNTSGTTESVTLLLLLA